ncbi:MAG: hypothetical protein IT324_20655 [Anaerolineae bacterium]|nr:hypothetical protein [Anaerolineae bacterium]
MKESEGVIQKHNQREQDQQARLDQFREATRAIGEEIKKSGLTEDEVICPQRLSQLE